jgi:alpha-beta hydrolase superfamily lysophospholipase
MESQANGERPVFVLLQHGSHGRVTDFAFLIKELMTKHGFVYCRGIATPSWWRPCRTGKIVNSLDESPRVIYDCVANQRFATDRGLEECCHNLLMDVVPVLSRFVSRHATDGERVKFSVVGHSFGGILLRRFIMLLHEEQPGLCAAVDFDVFMTAATPHLGARAMNRVLLAAGRLMGRVYSQNYRELLLMEDDGGPLANILISDAALDALAAFRVRRLYANLNRDMVVSFATAAVLPEGPQSMRTRADRKVPCTTHVSRHMLPTVYLKAGDLPPTAHESDATTEVKIATALRSRMDFEIVPTVSHSWLMVSHTQILSSPRFPFQALMDDVGTDMAMVLADTIPTADDPASPAPATDKYGLVDAGELVMQLEAHDCG